MLSIPIWSTVGVTSFQNIMKATLKVIFQQLASSSTDDI